MTQPVPAPPELPTAPAGNFTNPAFFLALVPTISFIMTTFFHKDLGLAANAQEWSIIAAGIVGLGAYVSRAVKHHANGQVLAAWIAYLNTQQQAQSSPGQSEESTMKAPAKRTTAKKTSARRDSGEIGVLVLVLVLLTLLFFGLGFAIKWLFIVAVIFLVFALVSGFSGSNGP